ncbi:MAG TPA: FAD-dependent oxidoreductase [Bacteroidia bacterium]|nr:FAD-dependent oxidoreductase [Bacteroidia bacterium]
MYVDRRKFLQLISAGGISILLPPLSSCNENKPSEKEIKVTIKGANSKRGHQVWQASQSFTKKITLTKDVVIIGGGVSGVSAAYNLQKNKTTNIVVLELADEVGGNSISGENAYSAYPYGAHYLTLPNACNTPLVSFLKEKGIVTSIDEQGRPSYNETDLCFDPEERLFIKGTFQDGLIPNYNLNEKEKKEISDFFALMDYYKNLKGKDEKYFFEIPYSQASIDTELDKLDNISFSDFLTEKKFTGTYLLWYLNYCCRDDFGGDTKKVSAWAGINYFASHKPNPANTGASRVLTWPEGNGHLIKLLADDLRGVIKTGCLVKNISIQNDKVLVTVADFKNQQLIEITCNNCVIAIPPYITTHILDKTLPYPKEEIKKLKHVPWVTAAVTLSKLPEGRGQEICWDNVGYDTKALGYIYNQHQSLKQRQEKQVISVYIPLDEKDIAEERKSAAGRTESEWKDMVLSELEILHNGITNFVEEIEIWIWGHGMILPEKGLIKGNVLKQLAQPINNQIYFAHTDLSGFSIFEEGFDWGYRMAEKISKKNEASLD